MFTGMFDFREYAEKKAKQESLNLNVRIIGTGRYKGLPVARRGSRPVVFGSQLHQWLDDLLNDYHLSWDELVQLAGYSPRVDAVSTGSVQWGFSHRILNAAAKVLHKTWEEPKDGIRATLDHPESLNGRPVWTEDGTTVIPQRIAYRMVRKYLREHQDDLAVKLNYTPISFDNILKGRSNAAVKTDNHLHAILIDRVKERRGFASIRQPKPLKGDRHRIEQLLGLR